MATKYRPILHVHVMDDLTGKLLADVDAPSTANALAYYLWSRRIDENATEASVATETLAGPTRSQNRRKLADTEPIMREQRHPITNGIEQALTVHVEGTANYCAGCQLVRLSVVV